MRVIDWVAEEILASGAPEERGCRATAPCPQAKLKKKKTYFCRYVDIKGFTGFTLQPKSVSEID